MYLQRPCHEVLKAEGWLMVVEMLLCVAGSGKTSCFVKTSTFSRKARVFSRTYEFEGTRLLRYITFNPFYTICDHIGHCNIPLIFWSGEWSGYLFDDSSSMDLPNPNNIPHPNNSAGLGIPLHSRTQQHPVDPPTHVRSPRSPSRSPFGGSAEVSRQCSDSAGHR